MHGYRQLRTDIRTESINHHRHNKNGKVNSNICQCHTYYESHVHINCYIKVSFISSSYKTYEIECGIVQFLYMGYNNVKMNGTKMKCLHPYKLQLVIGS